MSACISSRGEYSSHELDDEQVCKWCGVFDEEAFRRVNVAAAEARGRQQMIDALRDLDRYEAWVAEDMRQWRGLVGYHREGTFWPDAFHAPRFADYLDTIARAIESDTHTGDQT